MSKFVVVVVPEEKKAYQALHAIKALHAEGTVTYYGASIVARKPDGTLEVKQAADEGPLGLATGTLVGGLVGLLGGPVAAAVGLAAGGIVGGVRDIFHAGVSDEFIETVTRELEPGRFAVIAEVSEDWVTPIDMKMEALGGKVVREYRDEFVDDMLAKRADAAKSELARRKAELSGAIAEKMGARLTRRFDETKQDLQKTATRARVRLEEKRNEMNAKIGALEAQAGKAKADVKTRIDHTIEELRADMATREQKLSQAFELVDQALQ
jgi:uncharacterized membrane protein